MRVSETNILHKPISVIVLLTPVSFYQIWYNYSIMCYSGYYSCRTREEVVETAKAAGLTATEGPVQVLKFTEQLNSDDVKLFELPSELLTTLEAGDT